MASNMNDGIVFVDKQFVGSWHIRDIFKFAANMYSVSNIDT